MSESRAFPVRPALSGMANAESPAGPMLQGLAVVRALGSLSAVWQRLLVLFTFRTVIKLFLIYGQSQSLYEAHWRIAGRPVTWVNYVAFGAFLILGGLCLVALGRECRSLGLRSVRWVNTTVLVLSLSFIFLTFHNGHKNYLFPILSGVLKWDSLVPYVGDSLFFNSPFLAGWLFVYALTYYILARTGREDRVLFVTAFFGFAYGLINLRDLARYGEELLVIDCLGLLSLVAIGWLKTTTVAPPGKRVRLCLGYLMVPLVWSAFFAWILLRHDSPWDSDEADYFLSLLGVTLALFVVATMMVRKQGNPCTWCWLLPFFSVGFFLLTNTNYPYAHNYNHVLCLALTFPRYFMGGVMLVTLLGLAGTLYHRRWPKAGLWWLDAGGLVLLVVAGIDLRLSQIMGVRLGWDVLNFGDSPKMMLRMATPYLPGALAAFAALLVLYFLCLRLLRGITKDQKTASAEAPLKNTPVSATPRFFAFSPIAYLAILFVCLGGLGLATAQSDKAAGAAFFRLVRTSPWWKRVANRTLSREEFINSAKSLGLGDLSQAAGAVPAASPRDLNVLVVFMESSYNKHLSLFGSSEETQPLLTKYKDRMELFPNFFSVFAGSIYARFATFTSLYPSIDFHDFTQQRVAVKSLFEVLHQHGYTCSMFYSSYFDYTGFRDFLKNRGLDEMYDADTMPGERKTQRVEWGLLEEETLGAIRGQIKKYAQTQQRFCLTYVPAAPHYPYDQIPPRFQKYKLTEVGDFRPVYLNELLYMDWVIASIVDELKESGLLDHTLVIITNDHGEMLGGKDGHIGHGWAMTPQLANTPLIVMDPQRPGFQINKTIGTQVDILPTILDRLNIPVPTDQLYEGLSLDAGAARAGRLGYLNSLKEFGIISGDQILLGDRESNNPSGPASKGATYTMTNEGAKTVFQETGQAGKLQDRKATMERFDAFQLNLLRNYELYRASIRGAAQPQAKSLARSQ